MFMSPETLTCGCDCWSVDQYLLHTVRLFPSHSRKQMYWGLHHPRVGSIVCYRWLNFQQSEDLHVTGIPGYAIRWAMHQQLELPGCLSSQLISAVSALSVVGNASQQGHSKLWACRYGHRIADGRQIWNRYSPPVSAGVYADFPCLIQSFLSGFSLESYLPSRP